MIFGSLAVFSSIAFFAESHGRSAADLAVRHVIKMGIALCVMLFISKINYNVLARFSRLAILLSWMLLFAVLIFGELQFGARRSLTVGFISFQPSSIAASALILHVGVLLHEKQEYIKSFKRAFLPIMFWVGITFSLIAIEDFSSAAVLLGICILMMFVGRISMAQLAGFILIGLVLSAGFIYSSAERQSRITSYVTQVTEANNVRFDSGNGTRHNRLILPSPRVSCSGWELERVHSVIFSLHPTTTLFLPLSLRSTVYSVPQRLSFYSQSSCSGGL